MSAAVAAVTAFVALLGTAYTAEDPGLTQDWMTYALQSTSHSNHGRLGQ